MKKIIQIAIFVFGMNMMAQNQVNLSNLTSNMTLGSNCSQGQNPQEYITTGDVNLNGYTLNLRNVKLTINGNLNGGGSITHCGGSNLVVYGVIQSNPNTNGIPITFVTLNLKEFKLQNIKYYENVKIYTIDGKFISDGIDLLTLKRGVYIITAKNYKAKKIFLN